MTAPLVSVVVPTYDRPEALRRAVESVAAQTYEPIELLVVDDCSPTPAAEALSAIDPELASFGIVRHEDNRGGSAARNTGLEAATGEYVAFLDDDDEWHPTKIETQVSAFERVPDDVGLIYTGVRQVDARGRTNAVVARRIGGDVTERLLTWNFVGTFSAAMVRREVVERVGLLDERFPSWQDWEFYLRVSRRYRFGAIPEPLVVRHNRGEGQISGDYERKRDATVPLFEATFLPLAAEFGRLHPRRVEAALQYQLARSAVRAERYGAARRHAARAIARYPAEPSFYAHLGAVVGGGRTYELLRRWKRRVSRLRGRP